MDRQDAIKELEHIKHMGRQSFALDFAISDMRKMSYLTDRPCSVCKFNEDGHGCKKWTCAFEDD